MLVIVCSNCGHRNRPHKKSAESIRMVLMDELKPCRKCGREMRGLADVLEDTPAVRRVKQELKAAKIWQPPLTIQVRDGEDLRERLANDAAFIVELDLAYAEVQDEDARHLASCTTVLPALRTLSLSHTRISNRGIQALAQAGLLQQLEALKLAKMSITETAMECLKGLGNLRELLVSYINDAGAKAIADANLDSLESLAIPDSRVTNRGLGVLLDGLPASLASVRLIGGRDISDQGLKSLERLHDLKYCDPRFTGVTQQGVGWLKQRFPGCRVEWY